MIDAGPRLSVIVSTYERPDALRVVLEAYGRSTFRDFEVIVADDGSGPETRDLVARMAKDAPYKLTHAWQPHRGFRLAAARNLAACSAGGEVLVLTDGDCIPLPDALGIHASRCRPGRAQAGARYSLDEAETQRFLLGREPVAELAARAAGRRKLGLLLRRCRNLVYTVSRTKDRPKLLTANAAVHRADFLRVNGFDERFVGWGYEDEDLARRLRRVGVKVLDACRHSLVLHLFHPVHESHRPNARASANYRYFKTGVFLTRPLQGLEPRRVEDLSLELLGDVPEGLACLRSPAVEPPEVSLVFGLRSSLSVPPRGEVVLEGISPQSCRSPTDVHRLLAGAFESEPVSRQESSSNPGSPGQAAPGSER